MKKNFKEYIIESERLGLRNWEETDLQKYITINADAEVMKFFPESFRPDVEQSESSMKKFMKHYEHHGFTYFATDYLEDGEFIGFIGMKWIEYEVFFAPAIDIGWRLTKEYWGKGLASEGAKVCIDYFFQNFEFEKLVSLTPTLNTPSIRVMEKIGMGKVGKFNHPLIDESDPLCEHILYEIYRP